MCYVNVWMNRQKFKILDDALLCCDCICGERSELVQSYGKELSFALCKVVAEESQYQCSLFSRELSSFFLLSQTVALREHWSDNSMRRLCLHTTVQCWFFDIKAWRIQLSLHCTCWIVFAAWYVLHPPLPFSSHPNESNKAVKIAL